MENDSDADYYNSYASPEIHALMLGDQARVESYLRAIESNRDLFKDKIVIDIGAGSGILSLFAARAGARCVYAVEGSDAMCHVMEKIIEANGYSEVIRVVHGRVEDLVKNNFLDGSFSEDSEVINQIDSLSGNEASKRDARRPSGKIADVIISEWMGFHLLHESMLQSVILARDAWLKPVTGTMFPCAATLHVSLADLSNFWQENFTRQQAYHGFDFRPFAEYLLEYLIKEPLIIEVGEKQTSFSTSGIVASLDLHSVTSADLEVVETKTENPIKLRLLEDRMVHGFVFWFDVCFPHSPETEVVVLSTSPAASLTHWKQSVALLPQPISAVRGLELSLRVTLTKDSKQTRQYTVETEVIDAIVTDE